MTDVIENGVLLRPACSLKRFVSADIKDQILVIWVPPIDRHAGVFESVQRVKESTTSEMSDYHTKHFIISFSVTCHASCHVKPAAMSRQLPYCCSLELFLWSLVVARRFRSQWRKTFFVTITSCSHPLTCAQFSRTVYLHFSISEELTGYYKSSERAPGTGAQKRVFVR